MKQISLSLVIALVSVTCICGMCSKEDEAEAPAAPITSNRTSGLLITKGRTRNGTSDSLIIYHGFSWVGDWLEAYARPYVNPNEMYWHLVHTGANRWRIELNKAVYTGAPNKSYMKYFPNAPQQQRSNFTVVPRTSDSTLFLLNWTGSHFTIRPVLNPSLFLNTASWDGNPPEHTVLRFTTTPQDFFLIP
jgi:hypothetical protein